MKKRDAFADRDEVTIAAPASVQSGLTVEQLRGDLPNLADCPRLVSRPQGGLMHPTLATVSPAGPGWLHEIKWDGVRVLAVRSGTRVRLLSRSGIDVTARHPAITTAFARLGGGDFAFDGEIVALDTDGRPRFEWLAGGAGGTLVCYLFDCLAIDGRDVRSLPLITRKAICRQRLGSPGTLRYCDHVDHDGAAFLAAVRVAGLEGVVAKRAASAYRAGRSRDWVKVKCAREATFVIGGWSDPAGSRGHLGALHLGERRGRQLRYVGRVGSGFDAPMLAALAEQLGSLATPRCPFTEGAPPEGRGHHWVRPALACRVAFAERTRQRRLRHPVFKGLTTPAGVRLRARSARPRPRARPG
jgi:bifunctional non-homologous end joining protein LigD